MRKVAVIGVGMTQFGKFPNLGIKELGEEACWKALKDANIEPGDVQVGYCGTALAGIISRQGGLIGQLILKEVGITRIPVTRVENACASGSSAFHETWMAVASGLYDVGIAIGVEKMSEVKTAAITSALAMYSDVELEADQGYTFPGYFALVARKHMRDYGTTPRQLAMVSVKNHANGARNPYSQYRDEVTVEEVLESRMISDPLRVLDCCPVSDGAAAVILAGEEVARSCCSQPVWVAASAMGSGAYASPAVTAFEVTTRVAREAYRQAGVSPEDIDLAEVHDAFTINEILHYEDLGFCAKGQGGAFIEEGHPMLGGRKPVNTSGGLIAKGHPVGATGLAQIAEATWQLRGAAGARQVPGARVALTHCVGGFTYGEVGACCVNILVGPG